MPMIELRAVGQIAGAPTEALAGITDLEIFETADGTVLISVTRGGGSLVSYDLGSAPGGAHVVQSWSIDSSLTQLESTDLAVLNVDVPTLLMAGLATASLLGRVLNDDTATEALGGQTSIQISGADARNFTDIAVFPGTSYGLVAVRGSGVMSFEISGSSLSVAPLNPGPGLAGAPVSDLVTADLGGRSVALATYWGENAIALFELGSDGAVRALSMVQAAPESAWFSMPTAAALAEVAGRAYAIVAAAGSDSLTVLEIDPAGGMSPTDHVLDTRDTRFADVTVFEAIEVNGLDIIVAAGSDDGLSAFVLLPGGRLHHLGSIAGSADLPLSGITEIALQAQGNTVRIFVATESAPFLAEVVLTLPSPGDLRLAGNGGGTLAGTGDDDVLAGGHGADRIEAGAGDDILLDGAGSDTLTGGAGADDFLFSADGVADVILDFEPGVDRIDLTALGMQWDFSDVVMINRSWGVELRFGDEVIELRRSGLTSAQLSEADFISFAHVTYTGVELDLPPSLQMGSVGDDNMYGDDGANRISGRSGRDRIEASGGNDTLWGDDGEDVLLGGGGNDSLLGGTQNDVLWGNKGADTMLGNAGNDSLFGGFGFDMLSGGNGRDMLDGSAGADRLFGGMGYDLLRGGMGQDELFGGLGFDTLQGGLGDDEMQGGGGNDLLNGGLGDDRLSGGAQHDTIFGDAGDDTLHGELGHDTLRGRGDDDIAFGGAGDDLVAGGTGQDTLNGNQGDDTIQGGRGFDRVFGGAGNDRLIGGRGLDRLDGGLGDDRLTGGRHADRFVFADGHGQDTITDFDALDDGEKIDLSAVTALADIDDVLGSATQEGADVVIATGGATSILLLGVNLSELDASDFVF
ncbi:calcium-binding protein [Marimonas arenosa]|uniref:Uncharacterized protein n=1 Tax=Marimonas arenosa TaxID=1795305 RepID=A0AAE4B5F1_9RHOB|nr:calcium-binding protein [Marimonas arenosa]MDQ2090274.1 hypothetical protein [Marimonas arenosa]